MPSLKTSVLHRALTYGVCHWFLLPNGLLMFSAFLQVYTYGIATAVNQTSAASVQLSVQPTPSSKSPTRRTRPVTETTSLRVVNSISTNPQDFKTSEVLILSKQTTWIVQPSRGNNTPTDLMGNNDSSVIGNKDRIDEDKSVVFYRKIGGWITLGVVVTALVFLTVTHLSSIHYANKRGQIKEPFCSISQRSKFV
ncbi:uncharacterized protein LOC144655334 [Oculina patagonica]